MLRKRVICAMKGINVMHFSKRNLIGSAPFSHGTQTIPVHKVDLVIASEVWFSIDLKN